MRKLVPFGVILFYFSFASYTESLADDYLRIASYNTENLWDHNPNNTQESWDTYLDTLPLDVRISLPRSIEYNQHKNSKSNWYTQNVLMNKSRNMIKTLELAGYPDIVGLQELESAGNTSQVFSMPYSDEQNLGQRLHELGYHYQIVGQQEAHNPVAVTTGFISKIPIHAQASVVISSNFYNSSARDIQVVESYIERQRVLIFNAHFKSKAGGNEEERIKSASALRRRIAMEREKDEETNFIVMGDLNTAYFERPLKFLNATGNEHIMLQDSQSALYNLWFELEQKDRWDHSFNGRYSNLSHILVSDTLFDHQGLQLVERSFQVVGQSQPVSDLLLGPNGDPYRWQIQRHRNYFKHLGRGFSDHLPLVATFKVMPYLADRSLRRQKMALQFPSAETESDRNPPLIFSRPKICNEDIAEDGRSINWQDENSFINKCIKIDVDASDAPMKMYTRGKYQSSYIKFPFLNDEGNLELIDLGVSINRAYDWRPNIDDSRVSIEEASIKPGKYSQARSHPKSNRCFLRKVLQGRGGDLRRIVGYVAYSDGYLNFHVASREAKHIILENLPKKKKESCRWY